MAHIKPHPPSILIVCSFSFHDVTEATWHASHECPDKGKGRHWNPGSHRKPIWETCKNRALGTLVSVSFSQNTRTGLAGRGSYFFECPRVISGLSPTYPHFSPATDSGCSECWSAWFRSCCPLVGCSECSGPFVSHLSPACLPLDLGSLPAWFRTCLPLVSQFSPPRSGFFARMILQSSPSLSPAALSILWLRGFKLVSHLSSNTQWMLWFPTCALPLHSRFCECDFRLAPHLTLDALSALLQSIGGSAVASPSPALIWSHLRHCDLQSYRRVCCWCAAAVTSGRRLSFVSLPVWLANHRRVCSCSCRHCSSSLTLNHSHKFHSRSPSQTTTHSTHSIHSAHLTHLSLSLTHT